jgi:membrane protease YdiL (CAAX protease family)
MESSSLSWALLPRPFWAPQSCWVFSGTPIALRYRGPARGTWPAIHFFTGMLLIYGAVAAGLTIAITLVQHKQFGDVIGSRNWALVFRGACIWALAQLAITLIDLHIAPRGFSNTLTGETMTRAIFAFPALAVQTFAEEFVFRGYVTQGILLATRRPLLVAALSGLLFRALHIWNGLPQAAGAVVFGIVSSLIAIRTGGIAFTFGLHLVNNYLGAVAVVSAGDVFKGSPGVILQNTLQLMWWEVSLTTMALATTLILDVVKPELFPKLLTGGAAHVAPGGRSAGRDRQFVALTDPRHVDVSHSHLNSA